MITIVAEEQNENLSADPVDSIVVTMHDDGSVSELPVDIIVHTAGTCTPGQYPCRGWVGAFHKAVSATSDLSYLRLMLQKEGRKCFI